MISPELTQFLYKVAASMAVGVVMGIVLWPFRRARKEISEFKSQQEAIYSELVQQRENHLTHIEDYGKQQTELLTKACEVLDGVRLDLREQTVILRMGCPRTRRAAAKK